MQEMTFNTYRPDGKIKIYSIPVMLILGSAFGIASAGIIHLIWVYTNFYLMLFFPALIGLTTGFGLKLGVKTSKARNIIIGVIISIITGLIAYSSMHIFDALRTGLKLNQMDIYLEITSTEIGYNIRDIEIKGIGVWIIWSIELLIVIILSLILTIKQIIKPFNSNCDKWCYRYKTFNISKEYKDDIIKAVTNNDFETIEKILFSEFEGTEKDYLTVNFYYAENCYDIGYLTIKERISKDKKNYTEVTLVKNLIIDDSVTVKKIIDV
ncbi:MAG: hypothetical protein ACOCV8_04930 [Spirochaetota bacterium]